jgi:hypothetical protein
MWETSKNGGYPQPVKYLRPHARFYFGVCIIMWIRLQNLKAYIALFWFYMFHYMFLSIYWPSSGAIYTKNVKLNCECHAVFLFVIIQQLFFNNADYTAPNERVIREWWNGKDFEGSGRSIILRLYPGTRWRDWEKPRKPSVRIRCLRDDIWTRDLPNMK